MSNIEHIGALESRGKLFVTRKELEATLGVSASALGVMIYRLKKEGRLVSLRGGCYLIVPLLYRQMGAPPIEWYLDDYMKFLNINYYVGLLTAAAYHGSSHQSPQVYQVITDKKRKPIKAGRTRIRFAYKNPKDFKEQTFIQRFRTTNGEINLSSPESTALDLLIYERSTTSLNNIATVIAELAPNLNKDVLSKLVGQISSTYSQRLGYILEQTAQEQETTEPLLEAIFESLKNKDIRYRLLHSASKHSKKDLKDSKWHLIINTQLELDDI